MRAYQILRRGVTAIGVVSACITLGACGSSSNNGAFLGGGGGAAAGSTTSVFLQVDTTGDGFADTIGIVDAANPLGGVIDQFPAESAGGSLLPSNKSYFYEGSAWFAAGGNVWGIDPVTRDTVPRKATEIPSFQANREGLVDQGQVNLKSSAPFSNAPKAAKALLAKGGDITSDEYSQLEALGFDACDIVEFSAASSSAAATKVPDDTIMHNTGYSPVGIDVSPDGNMVVMGVRLGDHLLFIDTDPTSPTYLEPVRFVILRTGEIKDKSNAVIDTFASQYAGVGGAGTAPGDLNRDRDAGATGGETDGETYVEPCDSNIIRTANGEVWFGSVDVDGDTITLARVDTINTLTPTVVQFPIPLIDNNATIGTASGLQFVGPWMGTMHNRDGGNEALLSVENEGENNESIFDVTNSNNPFEVQRIVDDLADIKAFGGGTLGGPFVDGDPYDVDIDFTSTGGGPTLVTYEYHSLPGDDLSGASNTLTTAFLAKASAGDPGPNFILNGLTGRAGTSEGNFASTAGSGPTTTVFSDEIWLSIFQGGTADIFQVVDLSGPAPWLINRTCNLPSSFGFVVSPDNKIFQATGAFGGGDMQVIDMASCTLEGIVDTGGGMKGSPVIGQAPG